MGRVAWRARLHGPISSSEFDDGGWACAAEWLRAGWPSGRLQLNGGPEASACVSRAKRPASMNLSSRVMLSILSSSWDVLSTALKVVCCCFCAFHLPSRSLMSLNSQKFFSTQALSYGVSAASLDRMKDRGWMSMGAFAFSTSSAARCISGR